MQKETKRQNLAEEKAAQDKAPTAPIAGVMQETARRVERNLLAYLESSWQTPVQELVAQPKPSWLSRGLDNDRIRIALALLTIAFGAAAVPAIRAGIQLMEPAPLSIAQMEQQTQQRIAEMQETMRGVRIANCIKGGNDFEECVEKVPGTPRNRQ
mgnify:CR=1 FL=1